MTPKTIIALQFAGVSLTALSLLFIWNSYSSALIPKSQSNESGRSHLFASLKGTQLYVPNTDIFGKKITQDTKRKIVVLPGCNACTVRSDGSTKLPIIEQGAIYFTSDEADLESLRLLASKVDGFVVLDIRRKLMPALAYDIAPLLIELDGQARIKVVQLWP